MFQTFAERNLIGDMITMGYIMIVAFMLLVGYHASKQVLAIPRRFVNGLLAGGVVGLAMLLLAYLIETTSINDIFTYASSDLVELITLEQGMDSTFGRLFPVLGGSIIGLVGAGLTLIPKTWRRIVIMAIITTVLIALLRAVIAVLLPDAVESFFFTSSGLTFMGTAIVVVLMGGLFYGQTRLREYRSSRQTPTRAQPQKRSWQWWVGMLLLSLFLLSFPLWSKNFLSNVAVFVGLYIIMGMGLNLVIGFAGMLDLGFVAFYAIGAYTMAVLTSPELGFAELTFWQALPFSMLFATIGGAILAMPILKMRGDYLAIATLGFGEIIRILALSDFLKPYMGGAQGITRIARPEIGDMVIKDPQQFYYIVLVGCLLAWYIGSSLKRSRLGRAWMAIREDEDVAQAMGINRVMVKLSAFVIGAFLGGLSGGLFAGFIGSVVPKSFELLISINVLALIIVGGMGSLPGVVVGALAMVGLPELLREFGEYRMLVYGAVVVLMMLYRPQGLWPESVIERELKEKREAEEIGQDIPTDDVPVSPSLPQSEH
jgi:branched-chain amino acid transport system permease protein